MEELLKKIVVKDDGILEVTMKRARDFDDYIYQQIQKDDRCLPCHRDTRSKTRLFYDRKGYITMQEYLVQHVFEPKEVLPFLLYVLEDMVKVNAGKPVSMKLEHVFLSQDQGRPRFLVFPIVVDNWLFQKSDCRCFIEHLLEALRFQQDYEVYGYLSLALREEEVSLPQILQGLLGLKQQQVKPTRFWERLLHLAKEDTLYQPKGIPQPLYQEAAQIQEEEAEYQPPCVEEHETMELLGRMIPYLENMENGDCHVLGEDLFRIGRGKDNDLQLPYGYVSTHHACIREGCKLEDLHSANGTTVNEQAITKTTLQEGDVISFANVKFRYAWKGEQG